MSINWKWPSTPDNDLVPVYRMLWSLLWFPVFIVGKSLCFVAIVAVNFSFKTGLLFWRVFN